ncbi:hypothetical protein BDD12DRAFT_901780 [Trichophaea hybrida]|nr:hypothetical protein BDD12DRAFT_901780 [Trichophaea hybrida]
MSMDTGGKKRTHAQANMSAGPSDQDGIHWPSRDMITSWDAAIVTEWLLKHPSEPFDGRVQDLTKWRQAGVYSPSFIRLVAEKLQGAPLRLNPAAVMSIADLNEELQVRWDANPLISEELQTARVKQRKCDILQEKLTTLRLRLNDLPSDIAEYMAPAAVLKLPFIYPGQFPSRFCLGEGYKFSYFARSRLQALFSYAMKMDPDTNNRLHINGALVPPISSTDLRALEEWKDGTFAHQDAYLSNKIMALSASAKGSNEELEKEVLAFCAEVSELGMYITFIIDQTNALDDAVDDRISNDKKRQVRRFLDGRSSQHINISSSSANYLAAKHDKLRQTGEERIDIFDGLDAVEMKAWWLEFHWSESFASVLVERTAPEDPPFESLLEKIRRTPDVERIIRQIQKFANDREKDYLVHPSTKERYTKAWQACILEEEIAGGDAELLDSRFYYRDTNGIGRYAVLVAKKANKGVIVEDQITIDVGHKNTEADFNTKYEQWKIAVGLSDVEFRLLWIEADTKGTT